MRVKRYRLLGAVLVIIIISLNGCSEIHTSKSESSYIENMDDNLVFLNLPKSDEGYDYFKNEVQGYESYKKDILKETGLDKDGEEIVAIVTKQVEKGKLTAENESTVIIFDVKIRESSLTYHIPVLVIDNNGKLFYELLSSGYNSILYLRDIDGDGYSEIVTQCCVAMSGGAGAYDSAIYTLKNNNLSLMYHFDHESMGTGFSLKLSDGYNHTISNKYTSFITSFVRNQYETPYFDENGNITNDAKEYNNGDWSLGDTFYIFEPYDIDNDGVYEILTAQYCSLYGHSDGIGTLYTVLKYDMDLKTIFVTKAGFWQQQDVGEDEKESYYDEWDNYENNWFKK